MEWELQDQDNGFAGFEGVLRPFDGLELFGEILVDDLGDAKDLFRWEEKKLPIALLQDTLALAML